MKIIRFFYPHVITLVLFFALFAGTFYLTKGHEWNDGGAIYSGYPNVFWQHEGCYGPPNTDHRRCWGSEISSYPNLLLDALIWYLVACGIYFGIQKIRAKNSEPPAP